MGNEIKRVLVVGFTLIMMILAMNGLAVKCQAHEVNGWKHHKGVTHSVGSLDCPIGRLWWVIDENAISNDLDVDDWEVIECRFVRFIHGKQHKLSFTPVENDCYCAMWEDVDNVK